MSGKLRQTQGTWVLWSGPGLGRLRGGTKLFPQLPGKYGASGTREGKGRALLSSDQSWVPCLSLALVLGPSPDFISLQETVTLLGLPILHLSPAWTEMLPGTQQFPRLLPVGGSTQGRGLAIFPASASMSFTHSWARRASATTCISAVFLPPLSPQRPELGQPHEAQAAENRPRALTVPVLTDTQREQLVLASGYQRCYILTTRSRVLEAESRVKREGFPICSEHKGRMGVLPKA